MDIFLFLVLGITVLTDIRWFKVFNWLLYPSIVVSTISTGFWFEILIAFMVMAMLIRANVLRWHGGDVKLFMLISACKGWLFLPVVFMSRFLEVFYRKIFNKQLGLPLTPFVFVALILTMLIAATLKAIVV